MSDGVETASAAPLLRAERLVKHYPDGNVQALRGVSLEISAAESVAITGPSGCGKSTLLHLLGGLDRPTSGEVYFRGQSLAKLDIDHFRAHEVGFVFQSFYLMPTLTALENIQIPMFEGPWHPRDRQERAERLIGEVGLSHRRSHRPSQLSIGERQRVAIARAIANEPRLLLADEPTGAVDSITSQRVLDLIGELRIRRGMTAIVVSYDPQVGARADRMVTVVDGVLNQPAPDLEAASSA